jgi:hypothetical protein
VSLLRQFANSSVMMVFFVCATGTPAVVYAQTDKLNRFVGHVPENKQLSKQDLRDLDVLVGKIPTGYAMVPVPWYVWKTNGDDQTRYVVLLGESLSSIPGGSSACLQLFDSRAKKINSWSFQTGWRINLVDASIEYSTDLASYLIILDTARAINGLNIAKEYFAISGDRLRLVRMENDKGALVQNEYVLPVYEVGLVPDAKTVDEWAGLLESKDKADVLSALVFLGGRHIDGPGPDFGVRPMQSKYAPLFLQLLGSPRIREIIERLRNSDDDLIRQAAGLAARGPRDRLMMW